MGGKERGKRQTRVKTSLPGFTNSSQQNDQIRACVSFLTPTRFGTKGKFGELAKLFEEGIANGGVQSLNKSKGQREDNQGTLYCQWWEMCFQIFGWLKYDEYTKY